MMAERRFVLVKPLSFDEQLSKFPFKVLDGRCAESHLIKLTDHFSKWQTHLSTNLGLTAVEVEDIELNWPRDSARQRVEMFRRWQEKMKSQATYRYIHDIV